MEMPKISIPHLNQNKSFFIIALRGKIIGGWLDFLWNIIPWISSLWWLYFKHSICEIRISIWVFMNHNGFINGDIKIDVGMVHLYLHMLNDYGYKLRAVFRNNSIGFISMLWGSSFFPFNGMFTVSIVTMLVLLSSLCLRFTWDDAWDGDGARLSQETIMI